MKIGRATGADLETVHRNVKDGEHGSLEKSVVSQPESDGGNKGPDGRCGVSRLHTQEGQLWQFRLKTLQQKGQC